MSKELTTEIERIQEVLNVWLDAIKEDDEFYPKEWALEKLWMDLNILKRNVNITFASLNHDEVPESLSKSFPIELSTGESSTSSS